MLPNQTSQQPSLSEGARAPHEEAGNAHTSLQGHGPEPSLQVKGENGQEILWMDAAGLLKHQKARQTACGQAQATQVR